VDLAPRLKPALLAKVVDEGAVLRLWTPASLQASLARVGTRPGGGRLARILADRGASVFDSPLEQRAEAALRSLGPFALHYQIVLGGRVIIIDLALPVLRVAVECDGWTVRSRSRRKFDEDRRRNNLLAAEGWKVVHLTSDMSDDEMRAAVIQVMLLAAAAG
jgi:very-short-patch-repair endonuclease